MENTRRLKILFAVSLFIISYAASCATLHAYAVPGHGSLTPDIPSSPSINLNWNDVFKNLSSPFQNFAGSLKSAANTPISNFNFSSSGITENVSSGTQNIWGQLMGVFIGFFDWIRGLIRGIVSV